MSKLKVLFLAADPASADPSKPRAKQPPRLKIDEEMSAITAKVGAAKYRDSLEFSSRWAVRPDDLLQALNEVRPHIVQFSGHGSDAEEILLVGKDGKSQPVSTEALTSLFQTLKDDIRVVFLNACYSRVQAEALIQVIDCAIGMSRAISDKAAITFSASFYRALGFGRSVLEAFEQGRTALLLEGIREEDTPQLLVRKGVDPALLKLLPLHDGPPGEDEPAVLRSARRLLELLEERAARYTAATLPADLRLDLETQRENVSELEARFAERRGSG